MPANRLLVLESDAYDNRANIPPAWFQRMEALPKAESRRFLRCCHDDFEGRVFTAFAPERVIPPFVIPRVWPFVRAFDPGVVGCGWVWLTLAVDADRFRRDGWEISEQVRDGCVIAFDEYAPEAVPIEAQVREVLRRERAAISRGDRRKPLLPLFTAIDPSDARQQTGRGIMNTADLIKRTLYGLRGQALALSGICYDYARGEVLPDFGPLRKAPNDETAFILKAQQGLAAGMYLFTGNCQHLIRQVREEAYEETAQGERRRKYAKRFHLLAAWKYGIMLEPELLDEGPLVRYQGIGANPTTGY
jgi:hypothetical protein